MTHGLRLFYFYFEEVHNELGASPAEILPLLDKCELHCITEKDATHLEFLWDCVNDFYGLTRQGWEEFRD